MAKEYKCKICGQPFVKTFSATQRVWSPECAIKLAQDNAQKAQERAEKKKLTYQLVPKNNKRVNDFFYKSKMFETVRETINDELQYVVNQPFNGSAQDIATFFHHYIDVKEGIV